MAEKKGLKIEHRIETKEEAIQTLKSNLCGICSYSCSDMDNCDVRYCDNKDAIEFLEKAFELEQEPCEDELDFVQPHKRIPVALDLNKSCNNAVDKEAAINAVYLNFPKGTSLIPTPEWIIRMLNNLPPVTPKQLDDVLDEIRAEIENHCGLTKEDHCRYCYYCHSVIGVREILEIVNKYKKGDKDASSN